jgi:tetratricopeptide (TPR) repeat protein
LSVESWDRRLSAALLELAQQPTAARHRNVALEYRRLGILDVAHAHLRAAVQLDHQDAAAFDGLARIWRDWGFPHLGLDDATRAVQLAPESAAAANTLGTLLQLQGYVADASRWYERALTLEPDAPYALNNLCYASVILRRESVNTCQRAVAAAPQSKDARNNLALAFAAAGNIDRARLELERSSDAASAQYNTGILYLADRQFGKAAEAFDAAVQINPRFEHALARANQARAGADGP